VTQLRSFLDQARPDRFYPLWVLEAASGMWRCELAGASLDGLGLDAGTLSIDITRVVVDSRVIGPDGKIENAQRGIAPGPFTLAALTRLVGQLDTERKEHAKRPAGSVLVSSHTVRSASVGDMREARNAGHSPATAPMRIAAPMPPAQASAGMTMASDLLDA
jgi:hypothetical protein